ncbi:MAG: prepilin-type N-terminal cleavage/methylation domain-containing protein [Acidobacteriota bacterium]|nr:prepilin-type N-terminal cleavage/methylation domain-containing protein [Acidobacteriota bacterium]
MKQAFTLLELLAAILIGALIMLMIAGGLRTAIQSWEAVQKKVGQNYNRRNALDLIKRQSSSLFFKQEADQLEMSNRGSRGRNDNRRNNDPRTRGGQAHMRPQGQETGEAGGVEFALPDGAHYFQGNLQELNFVSTVSFLSDFPGQVAVRYYVVQGQPEDDQSFSDLTTTRTDNDTVDDGELMAADMIDGDLYLVLEETNLFLAAASEEGFLDDESGEEGFGQPMDTMNFSNESDNMSQAAATNSMTLLGPLRQFSIRYRMPDIEGDADAAGGDEDWAEIWDVEEEGFYPAAIEFTLYYEDPGLTDDLPLEELDAIRMVIPVYDARNMARGGTNAPF